VWGGGARKMVSHQQQKKPQIGDIIGLFTFSFHSITQAGINFKLGMRPVHMARRNPIDFGSWRSKVTVTKHRKFASTE